MGSFYKSFSSQLILEESDSINKNNCAVSNFAIQKFHDSGIVSKFSLEALIPMTEMYNSNFRKNWYNSQKVETNDYIKLYMNYCRNASTQRVKCNNLSSIFDENPDLETDERIRFSKSSVVVVKNEHDVIGGSWLEGLRKYRNKSNNCVEFEQQMHIFLESDFEGMGLGKIIEWATSKYSLKPQTKTLSCSWDPNYSHPGFFFESIGYNVNNNYAKKIIK